jgi:Na+(H+)/acetate symporter ActP
MTVLIALIVTLLASATGLMIVFRNLVDDDVYDVSMRSVHSDMESAPSQEKQSLRQGYFTTQNDRRA